jgi:hypothetical protein
MSSYQDYTNYAECYIQCHPLTASQSRLLQQVWQNALVDLNEPPPRGYEQKLQFYGPGLDRLLQQASVLQFIPICKPLLDLIHITITEDDLREIERYV